MTLQSCRERDPDLMPPISCIHGSHPFSVGFLHLAIWANPFGLSILVKFARFSHVHPFKLRHTAPFSPTPIPQALISCPPPDIKRS